MAANAVHILWREVLCVHREQWGITVPDRLFSAHVEKQQHFLWHKFFQSILFTLRWQNAEHNAYALKLILGTYQS